MSESSSAPAEPPVVAEPPVAEASAAAPLLESAAAANGWVVFERDGDICAGRLDGEAERRARVVRSEGPFKIMRTRVWPIWSAPPKNETAADLLVMSASRAARRTDGDKLWDAAEKALGERPLGAAELVPLLPPPPDEDLPTGLPKLEKARAHPDFPRLRALAVALQNPAYFRRAPDGRFTPAPRAEMEKARASISARKQRRMDERRIALDLEEGKIPEDLVRDAVRLMTVPDKAMASFRALKKHVGGDGPRIAKFFLDRGVIPDAMTYFAALFERAWRTRARDAESAPLELPPAPEWPEAPAPAFSVDDEGASEVDDAFSATERGDGKWRIGVHIAAPAAVIAPGAPLDRLARARGLSVYFPHDRRLMLPPEAVAACSLEAGAARPALSYYFNFDPASAEFSGGDTVRERVRVAAAHTPEEWNNATAGDAAMTVFNRIAQAVDSQPEEELHRPERNYRIRISDGRPDIVIVPRGPAERAVEALMRKVNHAWGMMLAVGDVGVFRHRGMTLATPEDPPYAWTSSPLRRYADLANQRALLAILSGEFTPPENWSALARQFDERVVLARRHQRMMERYWSLRALQIRARSDALDAEWRDDGRARLIEYPVSGEVRGAFPREEGTPLKVRVHSINLLQLRVRFAAMRRQ